MAMFPLQLIHEKPLSDVGKRMCTTVNPSGGLPRNIGANERLHPNYIRYVGVLYTKIKPNHQFMKPTIYDFIEKY